MVRAIDAQQIIMQLHNVEKVQQIQQQHSDMQQRYFQLQQAKEDHLLRESVKNTDESEKAVIREKEEREENRKGKEKRENQKKSEIIVVAEEGESTDEGGHINIKV